MRLGLDLLNRPIVGSRLWERPLALALALRLDRAPAREVLAPHEIAATTRKWETRDSQLKVTPGPYAPLLIRLVHHPYALPTTPPARQHLQALSGLLPRPRPAALPRPRRYPGDLP